MERRPRLVRAARIAASHGGRVAIAEEYRIGGTCVIRGCVPKKLLVYASRFPDAFRDSAGFGWRMGPGQSFSWPKLIKAKDAEIARLSAIYERNLAESGVAVHRQRAMLDGPNGVRLADRTVVTSGKILIATGGSPASPDIPGVEFAISSNEAFDLKELPETIAISGGGYIAVEFAGIFAGLGAEVSLIHRGEKILRGFDEDVRDEVMEGLTRRGVDLLLNERVERIEGAADGRLVRLQSGRTLHVDQAMLAIGRRPLVKGLGSRTPASKPTIMGQSSLMACHVPASRRSMQRGTSPTG